MEVQASLIATDVHPNPVIDHATLRITTREAQAVRVVLFDILGRQVALLSDSHLEAGGSMDVTLDAGRLPAGTYFVRVQGDRAILSRTAVVVR